MKFQSPNLNVFEWTDGRSDEQANGRTSPKQYTSSMFYSLGHKKERNDKIAFFLKANFHITGSRHLTKLTAPPIICSRRQFQIMPFFQK